ncbi:hypothetical protein [Altererythrobacter sp. GH1-8]
MRGKKRCRMHGGKGSGAPRGNHNAWKHGARSKDFASVVLLVNRLTGGT